MVKILTLIYLFIILCSNNISYANDGYKIIIKVDNEIISNHDINKEKKYLSALNPKILNIPENEIKKISRQSLIREIIKKNEVDKYYDVNYESLQKIIPLVKNIYTRLGINSVEEFKIYLKQYDLNLDDVLKKLAIENYWNTLIYQKYKNQINIDEDKIKKKLKLESSTIGKEELFLLSEIVFTAKDKNEYTNNYKKILDTIKTKDFKSAATIYSSSDTAKFGGEIGWVGKNDISEKIYKKLSTLKINEFTKPLKIGTGFLLINLDDIKKVDRKNNLEEQYKRILEKETNRQLTQYSTIYYKKLEKKSSIYEN
tara:strand:+ start:1218 stop:2156 length:939 start_codon:yes stop_codon:yes gene_type:complete